jgi:hypothetical protein
MPEFLKSADAGLKQRDRQISDTEREQFGKTQFAVR